MVCGILCRTGALPKEESHKAMHEENFLRSWLREDVEGKEEGIKGRPGNQRER